MTADELEFEQVYEKFQPKIHRYLIRLIGSKEAEDLTQEVFIKVNNALHTFKNQSQLSTWVYQIATHAVIDRTRSRSFKQESTELYSQSDIDVIADHNTCSFKNPLLLEDQVVRGEMNECIKEFIAGLPENYRTVLTLSELEQFKTSEISVILGLSIGAVKIRLHRAKEKLKTELSANCNFYQTECCGRLACEPKGPSIITTT